MSSFAVVIVAYHSLPDLPACLDSLLHPRQPALMGVVLVVNPPDDGSIAYVREHYPEVQIVTPERNVGFAAGNNLGAALFGDADCLFILNPDTIVPPNIFNILDEFFTQHPQAGIAGLRILNPDGTRQYTGIRAFPDPLYLFKLRSLPLAGHGAEKSGIARLNTMSTPERVHWVAGMAMAVRGKLYRKLGGFDEGYYIFVEDIDLCWRAKKEGWETWLLPEPQVIHKLGRSMSKIRMRREMVHTNAMWRFLRRRYDLSGMMEKLLYFPLWLLDLLLVILALPDKVKRLRLRGRV